MSPPAVSRKLVYSERTVVTLKAVAPPGFQFEGWSGDITGTADTLLLNMDSDKKLTATFSLMKN